MRSLLTALLIMCATTGCGAAKDVSNLITSTPNAAALQVAEANVQATNTTLQSYFATHGSYDGATADALRALDAGLSPTITVTATATSYCIQSVVDGATASLRGPGAGAPQPGPCA
ncbi:MAG: hypothetical protein ACXVRJ_12625 [Gaiellaceae bacterium]